MNTQPIEKRSARNDGLVELHSIFHTIQGEGPFCGTPAVFVRLAGCNLRCPACDTDYTSNCQLVTQATVIQLINQYVTSGLVVITGGEPFRQEIGALINALVVLGYYVQVETNGTLSPPEAVKWSHKYWERNGSYIVCSPKAGKINPAVEVKACAFKYVVTEGNTEKDGLPTTVLGHSATPYVGRAVFFDRPVYVQPADNKDETRNNQNLQAAIESCMKHGYILQLQVHKLINVE